MQPTANEQQVAGNHYKVQAGPQHWDFVHAAGLGYHAGNATKYVDRFEKKAGIVDLRKSAHYCLKCEELGIQPPPQIKAMAAFVDYAAGRDMRPLQRTALTQILAGAYREAAVTIERLAAEVYPQEAF